MLAACGFQEGGRQVDELSNEPSIRDRVTLEITDGPRTVVDRAMIANVTTDEIWVVVGKATAERLGTGSTVRIVVVRPEVGSLAAETSVRRQIGSSGRLVALRRPDNWASHSRRANGRARLAIPAYLRPHAEGSVVPARTTNLSVGGFHCVTDLPVSVGHQFDVSLMLTPTSALDCRAQVVRLSDDPEDPSRGQLLVAFRFVDLTTAEEALVAEALAALDDETDATAVPASWHSGEGHGRLGS
jgi:hypothetical protein